MGSTSGPLVLMQDFGLENDSVHWTHVEGVWDFAYIS